MRTQQPNKLSARPTVLVGLLVLLAGLSFAAWLLFAPANSKSENVAQVGADEPALGLMTSLPIYWSEGDPFAALGSENEQLPWVRAALEQQYAIEPLDALSSPEDTAGSLDGMEALAIIQPRAISPADNVALDDWVRGGGKLLYAIDPMLTGKYDMSLGDPRHPIVSALVPPVFARWGLALEFDQGQPHGPRLIEWEELPLPVLAAGSLVILSDADPQFAGKCSITADGAIARCKVGEGQVTVLADAALFEPREGNAEAEKALRLLFAKALS